MNILPVEQDKRRRFGLLLGLALLVYIGAVILFIICY